MDIKHIQHGELIAGPGIYRMPHHWYTNSSCSALPRMTGSDAVALSRVSPAKFLASAGEDTYKPQTEEGSAAHLALLEPDRAEGTIITFERDDWATGTGVKDERARRDALRAGGHIVLTRPQKDMVDAIVRPIRDQPALSRLVSGGIAELTFVAQSPDGFLMFCRPDFLGLAGPRAEIVDYKTVASVDDDDLSRAILNFGYHIKAAWQVAIVRAVMGWDDVSFVFLCQERKAPYDAVQRDLDDESMRIGEDAMRTATSRFASCLRTAEWPLSSPERKTIGIPEWAKLRHQDREIAATTVNGSAVAIAEQAGANPFG